MAESDQVPRKRQRGTLKNAMKTYPGIVYHKRYSVACTHDEQGRLLKEARIEAITAEGFAAYFRELSEPNEVVTEGCWNWATLYDLLEETPGVSNVVLSHPAKNRIIADAQIKNDRVDAKALATLPRMNFVFGSHFDRNSIEPRSVGLTAPR